MEKLNISLKQLGLSESCIGVYKTLLELGRVSPRQISQTLGMARPTVYDQIKQLINLGLVVEKAVDGKTLFEVDDVNNVAKLFESRVEDLKIAENNFKKLLPSLKKSEGSEPRIRFFFGEESFRRVMNDVLWSETEDLLILWPYFDMAELIGDEYLASFTTRRVARGIKVKSIWAREEGQYIEKPELGLETARVAPRNHSVHMGYLIYKDKVSFISSRDESFSFTVTSRDFADLQRAHFHTLWDVSKPVK